MNFQSTITQTRTWQQGILALAQKTGFDDLYWYTQVVAPGNIVFPGAYPALWIPVVPVGPDPKASYRIAGMLSEFFKLSNPPAFRYHECLVDSTGLAGHQWYIWTESVPIDAVCVSCASVETVLHLDWEIERPNWLCPMCKGN